MERPRASRSKSGTTGGGLMVMVMVASAALGAAEPAPRPAVDKVAHACTHIVIPGVKRQRCPEVMWRADADWDMLTPGTVVTLVVDRSKNPRLPRYITVMVEDVGPRGWVLPEGASAWGLPTPGVVRYRRFPPPVPSWVWWEAGPIATMVVIGLLGRRRTSRALC